MDRGVLDVLLRFLGAEPLGWRGGGNPVDTNPSQRAGNRQTASGDAINPPGQSGVGNPRPRRVRPSDNPEGLPGPGVMNPLRPERDGNLPCRGVQDVDNPQALDSVDLNPGDEWGAMYGDAAWMAMVSAPVWSRDQGRDERTFGNVCERVYGLDYSRYFAPRTEEQILGMVRRFPETDRRHFYTLHRHTTITSSIGVLFGERRGDEKYYMRFSPSRFAYCEGLMGHGDFDEKLDHFFCVSAAEVQAVLDRMRDVVSDWPVKLAQIQSSGVLTGVDDVHVGKAFKPGAWCLVSANKIPYVTHRPLIREYQIYMYFRDFRDFVANCLSRLNEARRRLTLQRSAAAPRRLR